MKNTLFPTKNFLTLFYLIITGYCSLTGQTRQDNYDLNASSGNGFRFWNGTDRFKIHMGTGAEYRYGPVTDYSIKSNMDGNSGRGWTWGTTGKEPIAGLNVLGDFQIARSFIAKGSATVGDDDWGALIIDGKGANNWLLNAHSNGDSFFIRSHKEGESSWSNTVMAFNRQSGNVGIGTTSPKHGKLHIKSSGPDNGINLWTDTGKFTSRIWINDDTNTFHLTRGDQVTRGVSIDGDGKVGIGTANPVEKLHVFGGTASIEGNIGEIEADSYWKTGNHTLEIQNNDAGDVVLSFHRGGHSSAAILHSKEVGGLSFSGSGRSNAKDLNLLANGNVGIGTTDPKNKLSVEGTIWAKEVKVSLNDAADWVFEEDYQLRPLSEVESYIRKNKHLPEIPSAKEFRNNDLKVSEMTNKLLQKIEELTLYTIEQEKRLEKMKTLEARLEKLETLLAK